MQPSPFRRAAGGYGRSAQYSLAFGGAPQCRYGQPDLAERGRGRPKQCAESQDKSSGRVSLLTPTLQTSPAVSDIGAPMIQVSGARHKATACLAMHV